MARLRSMPVSDAVPTMSRARSEALSSTPETLTQAQRIKSLNEQAAQLIGHTLDASQKLEQLAALFREAQAGCSPRSAIFDFLNPGAVDIVFKATSLFGVPHSTIIKLTNTAWKLDTASLLQLFPSKCLLSLRFLLALKALAVEFADRVTIEDAMAEMRHHAQQRKCQPSQGSSKTMDFVPADVNKTLAAFRNRMSQANHGEQDRDIDASIQTITHGLNDSKEDAVSPERAVEVAVPTSRETPSVASRKRQSKSQPLDTDSESETPSKRSKRAKSLPTPELSATAQRHQRHTSEHPLASMFGPQHSPAQGRPRSDASSPDIEIGRHAQENVSKLEFSPFSVNHFLDMDHGDETDSADEGDSAHDSDSNTEQAIGENTSFRSYGETTTKGITKKAAVQEHGDSHNAHEEQIQTSPPAVEQKMESRSDTARGDNHTEEASIAVPEKLSSNDYSCASGSVNTSELIVAHPPPLGPERNHQLGADTEPIVVEDDGPDARHATLSAESDNRMHILNKLSPEEWLAHSTIWALLDIIAIASNTGVLDVGNPPEDARSSWPLRELRRIESTDNKILIPINVGGHWVLLCMVPESGAIIGMDSWVAGAKRSLPDIALALGQAVNATTSWHYREQTMPQQQNAYDCGVHVVMNAVSFVTGCPLLSNSCLWRILLSLLIRGQLTEPEIVALIKPISVTTQQSPLASSYSKIRAQAVQLRHLVRDIERASLAMSILAHNATILMETHQKSLDAACENVSFYKDSLAKHSEHSGHWDSDIVKAILKAVNSSEAELQRCQRVGARLGPAKDRLEQFNTQILSLREGFARKMEEADDECRRQWEHMKAIHQYIDGIMREKGADFDGCGA